MLVAAKESLFHDGLISKIGKYPQLVPKRQLFPVRNRIFGEFLGFGLNFTWGCEYSGAIERWLLKRSVLIYGCPNE